MKILVGCVISLFVIPCALSIKCEFCSTIDKSKNAPTCNRTVDQLVECGPGYDRCGTVTVTMESPDEPPMQMKNCSNAVACDPGLINVCDTVKIGLNRSGIPLKTCEYMCCKEDGCNAHKQQPVTEGDFTVKPTTQNASDDVYLTGDGVRTAAAHLGAIFFTLFLVFIC